MSKDNNNTSGSNGTAATGSTNDKFKLDDGFVAKYYNIPSPFRDNMLGWFVYQRTYSRVKDDGYNENWIETVRRVVEGTYNMQKRHVDANGLGWDRAKGQKSAQEMFDRIFHLKFTPPGRGLWSMGTKITEEKGLYTALNNCAFISTETIDTIVNEDGEYQPSRPFRFLMDVSMLGVGCGFDVKGAEKVYVYAPKPFTEYHIDDEDVEIIHHPNPAKLAIHKKYIAFVEEKIKHAREKAESESNAWVKSEYEKSLGEYSAELKRVGGMDPRGIQVYKIEDTREAWVKSVGLLIDSYLKPDQYPYLFDYSDIRPAGILLKTFGGYSSGPEPLFDLHIAIRRVLDKNAGWKLSETSIVDLMNLIGKCVVAGNIRRCCPKGTLVHTNCGLVAIEDIRPGMTAITSQGEYPITDLIIQGELELITIKHQIGEVKCTRNHRMAVMNKLGGFEFKYAEDIIPGDKLVFSQHILPGQRTHLPHFNYVKPKRSTTCKDIIIPELDRDLAWFFGYFFGNGYVCKGTSKKNKDGTDKFSGSFAKQNVAKWQLNSYVAVACPDNYLQIYEKVRQQLARFGTNLNIVMPKANDKCYKIRTQSKQLAMYMSQFKEANSEMNIPEFIMNGMTEIRAAFLAGLLDADGSLYQPKVETCNGEMKINLLSSVYPEFSKQVQCLYGSIGILSKVRKIERKEAGTFLQLIHRIEGAEKTLYQMEIYENVCKKDFISVMRDYSIKVQTHEEELNNSFNGSRNSSLYSYPAEWIREYVREQGINVNLPDFETIGLTKLASLGIDHGGLIPIDVTEVDKTGEYCEAYDISVKTSNYFAIDQGIISHNSAEIALGPHDSTEFIDLKDYAKNPERAAYGWCSNNSVYGHIGMDYSDIANRIKNNGEPGIFWLDNARNYSRMNGEPDYKDARATGTNPSLRAGTNIYTTDGIYPIEKLQDQEFFVKNLNGERSKAKCFLSGKNKRLWKITITGGHEYYATAEHEWPIFRKAHLLGIVPWGFLLDKKYRTDQLKSGMRLKRKGENNWYCSYIRHHSDEYVIRTREKVIDLLKNIAECTEDDKKFITDILGFWGFNCYIFKNKLYMSGSSDTKMYADSSIRDIKRCIDQSLDEYEEYVEIINVHETDLYEDVWDITVYDNTHCFQLAHCVTGNCSEQTLESAEMCCVSGDTRIQTLEGCPRIADVVGKTVSVWNGAGWSKVTPFIAGYNKKLYRVHLSDGTHLDCTGDHKWSIRDYSPASNQVGLSTYKQLETAELVQGHEVERFTLADSLADSLGNIAGSKSSVCFGHSAEGYIEYISEETFAANPYYIMQMMTCGKFMDDISESSAFLSNEDWQLDCANNLITDFAMLMRRCGYNSVKIVQKYHNYSRIEFAKHSAAQVVTAIEELPGLHTTYCFTEPVRHMGVFGNVLTYQCLVEVFPTKHETKEDFLRTLKFAYLYAKTVTLGNSHWPETNRVMMRNRRIGCSLTGIAEFVDSRGLETFRKWADSGYDTIQYWDKVYSDYLAVPRSIKTTSVKPSGCLTPDTNIVVTDRDGNAEKIISLEDFFRMNGYNLRANNNPAEYTDKYPAGTWLKPNGEHYIINKDGKPELVTELYIQGWANAMEIPLENGATIRCTPNHKFWVKSPGNTEPQWKEAQFIDANDELLSF